MKYALPLILILFGVLFVGVGTKIFFRMLSFKKSAIKTTATVTQIKTSSSKMKNTTYSPVLHFKTIDGQDFFYDVDRYYFRKYSVGEKIEILYLKNDPAHPQVNSFKQIFLPSVIMLFLGVFCILYSAYLLLKK